MATTTFACNKDSRIATSGGSSLGAGTSSFNPVGAYGSYVYRTLLGFSYSFAGMVSITSAILHFRTSTQSYVGFGSDPDMDVRRLGSSWSEGSSSGMSASNAVNWDNQPGGTGTQVTTDVTTAESTWDTVDITVLMQEALAAGVFYGLQLKAADEGTASDVTEIYAREQGSSDPYITVTYSTNVGPGQPVNLSPPNTWRNTGVSPSFAFDHVDADGDALLKYDLQVSTDGSFGAVSHWNLANATAGIAGNHVAVGYAGAGLARGATYYWRVRTYSATGILTASAWSPTYSFSINQLPSVALVQPAAADAVCQPYYVAGQAVGVRMQVMWSFSDPEGGAQQTWRVVVYNDNDTVFYDSGTQPGTASSITVPVDVVRNSYYKVLVGCTDDRGELGWSALVRCRVNWTVVEYKKDLGGVVTNWSANPSSSMGTNGAVIVEYASSAGGGAIGQWFSTIGGAALNRWFHWRVWIFAWHAASFTPYLSQMSLTYTSSVAVPPDGWTLTGQHALDTGTKVYGTQSLKATGNGSVIIASQRVAVEPNTDYILSGRIKSDGNTGAVIILQDVVSGLGVANTPSVGASQDWKRGQSAVWNSGANSAINILCWSNGAVGTSAWFDALKLEASKVVTPWTPGFIGPALSVDAGGLQIDATQGGVMRLRGSSGGARDRVALGAKGLLFGGDTNLYSDSATLLRTDGHFVSAGFVSAAGTMDSGGAHNGPYHLAGTGAVLRISGLADSAGKWARIAYGTLAGQYWSQGVRGIVQNRYGAWEVAMHINADAGAAAVENPVGLTTRTIFDGQNRLLVAKMTIQSRGPIVWHLWIQCFAGWEGFDWFPQDITSDSAPLPTIDNPNTLGWVANTDTYGGVNYLSGNFLQRLSGSLEIGGYFNGNNGLYQNGIKVAGPRRTGWGAMTGTGARTGINLETATIAQVGNRLKSLIDDLVAHGLIGP